MSVPVARWGYQPANSLSTCFVSVLIPRKCTFIVSGFMASAPWLRLTMLVAVLALTVVKLLLSDLKVTSVTGRGL